MSKTFNMVGGGAGASLAIIRLNGTKPEPPPEHDVEGGWDFEEESTLTRS